MAAPLRRVAAPLRKVAASMRRDPAPTCRDPPPMRNDERFIGALREAAPAGRSRARSRVGQFDFARADFFSVRAESRIEAGGSLRGEGDKRWHKPPGVLRAGRFAMTAIVRSSRKRKNSQSVHHHVDTEQGVCLGAPAGSHGRHGEAFPERVVHAREHRVHDGEALVQAFQALADALTWPWLRRTRAPGTG